jgi:hypothetical protein
MCCLETPPPRNPRLDTRRSGYKPRTGPLAQVQNTGQVVRGAALPQRTSSTLLYREVVRRAGDKGHPYLFCLLPVALNGHPGEDRMVTLTNI